MESEATRVCSAHFEGGEKFWRILEFWRISEAVMAANGNATIRMMRHFCVRILLQTPNLVVS
jgi:hypothetical protein